MVLIFWPVCSVLYTKFPTSLMIPSLSEASCTWRRTHAATPISPAFFNADESLTFPHLKTRIFHFFHPKTPVISRPYPVPRGGVPAEETVLNSVPTRKCSPKERWTKINSINYTNLMSISLIQDPRQDRRYYCDTTTFVQDVSYDTIKTYKLCSISFSWTLHWSVNLRAANEAIRRYRYSVILASRPMPSNSQFRKKVKSAPEWPILFASGQIIVGYTPRIANFKDINSTFLRGPVIGLRDCGIRWF